LDRASSMRALLCRPFAGHDMFFCVTFHYTVWRKSKSVLPVVQHACHESGRLSQMLGSCMIYFSSGPSTRGCRSPKP